LELFLQQADVSGVKTSARVAAWGLAPEQWGLSPAWQWSVQAQQAIDGSRRAMVGVSLTDGRARWAVHHYAEPSINDRGWLARADYQGLNQETLQLVAHAERSVSLTRDQGSVRAGFQVQWLPAPGWRMQAQWQGQFDLHGYSPLLESGAPRRLRTTQLALERTFTLKSGKTLSFRALTTQRTGNIELFAFKEASLQVIWGQVWR
jgi:hypothetical protein